MQEQINELKNELEKISNGGISILSIKEIIEMYPGCGFDDCPEEDQDELMIVDVETNNEDAIYLEGAYVLNIVNDELVAIWSPYPSDPIVGKENILKQITKYIS